MIALHSHHPLESQCWKAIWQAVQLSTSTWLRSLSSAPFHWEVSDWKLEIMHHHTRGCRSSSPCVAGFVGYWCCALPTLQKHTVTESRVVSCAITPYTWLKCDGREEWAAGSWGQGRDCDLTCNQTFYQSSLTSEGPGPLREAQEHWEGAVIVPHLPPPPQQDSLYNDQGGHSVSQFTGQK